MAPTRCHGWENRPWGQKREAAVCAGGERGDSEGSWFPQGSGRAEAWRAGLSRCRLCQAWAGGLSDPRLSTLQSLVQSGLPGGGVPSELPQLIPVFPGGTPLLPPVVGGSIPVSSPLPPASFGLVMDPSKKLTASVLDALDPPGSALDSLDLLPYSETRLDALDSFGSTRGSLDKPGAFMGEAWVAGTPSPPDSSQGAIMAPVSGVRSWDYNCLPKPGPVTHQGPGPCPLQLSAQHWAGILFKIE